MAHLLTCSKIYSTQSCFYKRIYNILVTKLLRRVFYYAMNTLVALRVAANKAFFGW